MELAKSLCIVLFSAILVDNFVLLQVHGLLPLPRGFQKPEFRLRHELRRHFRHGDGHRRHPSGLHLPAGSRTDWAIWTPSPSFWSSRPLCNWWKSC